MLIEGIIPETTKGQAGFDPLSIDKGREMNIVTTADANTFDSAGLFFFIHIAEHSSYAALYLRCSCCLVWERQ